MKENFIAILDLAATVEWGYDVRLRECDCEPSPDWWLYITRPGQADYGSWRTWAAGDERNIGQAARMIAAELTDDLLAALNLKSPLALVNALATGVIVHDRPARFVFRQ